MDDYLGLITDAKRAALEDLRRTIREIVPEAEEGLSYGLAAFRLKGRPLVAFGAAAHHCALYPMSPGTLAAHAEELKGYDLSKGTIRFQPEKPLPVAVVRKIVRARIAEAETPCAGSRRER